MTFEKHIVPDGALGDVPNAESTTLGPFTDVVLTVIHRVPPDLNILIRDINGNDGESSDQDQEDAQGDCQPLASAIGQCQCSHEKDDCALRLVKAGSYRHA